MNKSILILTTLIIILFDGCTKYDDGPRITFRSAYKRISGIWQVNTFEVDGVDSLQLYNQILNSSTIEFLLGDGPESSDIYIKDINGIGYFGGSAGFNWNTKKMYVDTLFIYLETSVPKTELGPFGNRVNSIWKIHRFTSKELWIDTYHNNNLYYLRLKKIKKNKYS